MKTNEGEELEIGECQQMPVKYYTPIKKQLEKWLPTNEAFLTTGSVREYTGDKEIQEKAQELSKMRKCLCDCGRKEPHVCVPRSMFLEVMEKKYYDKVVEKIKPANYRD